MKAENIWGAIYEHPDFDRLVKTRRSLVTWLMVLSMSVYFAIPVITASAPSLLHIHIWGAINTGLVYLIGQYAFGTAIAVYYAYRLKRIDQQSEALLAAFAAKAPTVNTTSA